MFTVTLIETDLRERGFEVDMDSTGTRVIKLCEHRNVNVRCSSIIKQFKLKIKYFNRISIVTVPINVQMISIT